MGGLAGSVVLADVVPANPALCFRILGTAHTSRRSGDRDAITAMVDHSGLEVESFFDGDKGHISIQEEIRCENGTCMKSLGNLSQSVAVLRKM